MPGCAVHTLLATRILARWDFGDPDAAPFPVRNAHCRAAFYTGSMGPDFGYYPTGDTLFAELAHYLRAVELTRTLIRVASDPPTRAFAWGWATHVLADTWIHPVINREVARRFGRGEAGEISFAEDPVSHVRVEVGIDAAYALDPDVPSRPWRAPIVDRVATDALADAYDATYSIRIDRNRLRSTRRAALWLLPRMLAYERLIAPGVRGDSPRAGAAEVVFRTAAWLLPRRSAARGLLRPVAPTAALLCELDVQFTAFVDAFLAHQASGLAGLPEYNLDTGAVEGEESAYPPARSTRMVADRMRVSARGPEEAPAEVQR